MESLPVLRGDRVLLRPVREDDIGARDWRDLIEEDEEAVLAIEVGGALAGMLLVGEEEMAEFRHASASSPSESCAASSAATTGSGTTGC